MTRLHRVAAGAGAPVVFLHGIGASLEVWADQASRLARDHRTLLVDLRGHGRSPSPPAPWTLTGIAADVAACLREEDAAPAHVVGHSAGGVIAMTLAIEHPELVRSLCLVGTSAECNEKTANGVYLRLAERADREGIEPVLAALAMPLDGPPEQRPDPAGFAAFARAIATLHPAPIAPRLPELRVPTLVVVGEKDPFGVGGSVKIGRGIAGARVEILPERGHSPFTQDPAGFEALLRELVG